MRSMIPAMLAAKAHMVRVYPAGTEETKHEPEKSYWMITVNGTYAALGNIKKPIFSEDPNFEEFSYKDNEFMIAIPSNLEPGDSIICKAPVIKRLSITTRTIDIEDITEIIS